MELAWTMNRSGDTIANQAAVDTTRRPRNHGKGSVKRLSTGGIRVRLEKDGAWRQHKTELELVVVEWFVVH